MESSHGDVRQRSVRAGNTAKQVIKKVSFPKGGIHLWPEQQESSTLTATLPTSGLSFPQSNNAEDSPEAEPGYHSSYTGRLIREKPARESGGYDRGTRQVRDLDERALPLQPPQQDSKQTQGLHHERKKPSPEPTRRHSSVVSPSDDDRKPPYIFHHRGAQQELEQHGVDPHGQQQQSSTSDDNRKPPPQPYHSQKSPSPEMQARIDSSCGTPTSRICSLHEMSHQHAIGEEEYFRNIPTERVHEAERHLRVDHRAHGMDLEDLDWGEIGSFVGDARNTVRQNPDHPSWPRPRLEPTAHPQHFYSQDAFSSPPRNPHLQGTPGNVYSPLGCTSRLGLELESPRGQTGFAVDPSQCNDQRSIHQRNSLHYDDQRHIHQRSSPHSPERESPKSLYSRQEVRIQRNTVIPNTASFVNRDFSSSVTCTSSTTTEQTCHQGRDFEASMPKGSLPADWSPGALYPNPQPDHASAQGGSPYVTTGLKKMVDEPIPFPAQGPQGDHSSRSPVGGSAFIMKSPAESLIVSQLGHYLKPHSQIEQLDSPHRQSQHTKQRNQHRQDNFEVQRPLPPPPTKTPLDFHSDGDQQNSKVEASFEQAQEAPAETCSSQRNAAAQTHPADSHVDQVKIQDTGDIRRCPTCSSVPVVTNNNSDRPAMPEIPDRSMFPIEPTRVELDAVLSECISYQEYASGVIDDRQVIEEAVEACRIEREVMSAISTGQFLSLRELEESKEQLSTRMRSMQFEERLTHLPALEELTAMIKRETGKRLSLQPQQESTLPYAQLETPSVFLSYTGQDDIAAMFASSLSVALDNLSITNFFDASTLQYGEPWKKEIERSVSGCVVFVCILSPMFPFRKWCMHELDLAIRSNKRVLPVCVGSEFYNHTEDFRECFYNAHRKRGILDQTIKRWEQNIFDLSDIHAVRNKIVCRKTAYERMKGSVVAAIQRMLQQAPQVPEAPRRETKRLSRLSREMSRRLRVLQMHNSPAYATADDGNDSDDHGSGSGDHGSSASSSEDNSDNGGADEDRTRNQPEHNAGSDSDAKCAGADTSRPQQKTKERGIDHGNLHESNERKCSKQSKNIEDSADFSFEFSRMAENPHESLEIVAEYSLGGLKAQRVEPGSPVQDQVPPGDLITKIGDAALCGQHGRNDDMPIRPPPASPTDGRLRHQQPAVGLARNRASKTHVTDQQPFPRHTRLGTMAKEVGPRISCGALAQENACKNLRYKDQVLPAGPVLPTDRVLPIAPPVHHGEDRTSALTRQLETTDGMGGVSMVPACGGTRKFRDEAESPNAPLAVGVLVANSSPQSLLDPPTGDHPSDPRSNIPFERSDISSERPRRIKRVWKQLTHCLFKFGGES